MDKVPTLNIEFDPSSLAAVMEEKKVSQAELARLGGYPHRNVINRILKRKREATATDLLRFLRVLKCSPKDFSKN